MSRGKSTAWGFGAVLMWALLALLTVQSAPIPPFQLTALSFLIGGAIGLVWVRVAGEAGALRRIPWRVYAFGTFGVFGYHALYFSALRLAPAAEAGLIAYLWPLLIVLFSGLLPGERLRLGHVLGALVGFLGAALIVTAGGAGPGASEGASLSAPSASTALGLGLAFLCALFWSGYSVLSRRLGDVPSSSVAVFCLMTALLSGLAHLALEESVWPAQPGVWLAVLGLGLGPVGLAFYIWDVGVKRGDIQLLGVASYAAPLLSTLVLVAAGVARPSWVLALACLLITAGAALAARASRARGDGA